MNSSGVWAMPLPMVPATTTQAFRDYMEKVGDQEIIDILDRFGGMPSGESFPIREDEFQTWKRAGVIIKVCDTADFYDHIMYASACGWSFNTRGTEGYNTCYGQLQCTALHRRNRTSRKGGRPGRERPQIPS